MDFEFKKYSNNNGEFIEITSFKEGCDIIEIPEYIDGIKIDAISQRALSWSLNIKLFILHGGKDDFSLARFILGHTSQALRIRFVYPDGDLELAFPRFNDEVIEDTMARAIHLKIEGSGYAYRECVYKDSIDTASYDSFFSRAKGEGGEICADIALSRLMFPMKLSDEAKENYEDYVRAKADFIVKYLIESKDKSRLSFLFSHFDMPKTTVQKALMLTTANKLPSLTTVIMQNSGKNEK